MKDKVYLSHECLDFIVASAIEVYPRETNGLLLGLRRPRKCIALKTAYPIQTEERGPSFVRHGNLAALNRLMASMDAMNSKLVGGFHSHPYPNGHVLLTKSDLEFIEEEMGRLKNYENYKNMKIWLELILSIKKKDYLNSIKAGRRIMQDNGNIKVKVNTDHFFGFDIKLSGYIVTKPVQIKKGGAKLRLSKKSYKNLSPSSCKISLCLSK